VDLLEGTSSPYFKEFKNLFLNGFQALRKNYKKILSFVEMYMLTNADLPCFKEPEEVLIQLKERFLIHLTGDELRKAVNELIEDSRDHWRTKFYDGFQRCCVGIK
jgi:phosphatidylinositol 4-kinase B